MRYRTDRHNHRIVYRQLTDEPSDEDEMLAVFFDAIDAMAVVSMLNGDEDDALWADDPLDAARPTVADEPVFRCPACPHPVRDHTADGCPSCACTGRAMPLTGGPAPERCDAKLSDANEGDLHCERLEGHDGRHLDSGLTWLGDDPDTIGPLAQLHDGAAPVDEQAPVPPPVDALDEILNLVEEVALARVKAFNAGNRDDGRRAQQHSNRAKALRLAIAVQIDAVRAAGVAEGRRQRDAEIEQLQVLLDHAEQYARDLQDNGDVAQPLPVAPIVRLEFVVALPPGPMLGQDGVQRVLDRLGVEKRGDTVVSSGEPIPGDWPSGTGFIAYTVPVMPRG